MATQLLTPLVQLCSELARWAGKEAELARLIAEGPRAEEKTEQTVATEAVAAEKPAERPVAAVPEEKPAAEKPAEEQPAPPAESGVANAPPEPKEAVG